MSQTLFSVRDSKAQIESLPSIQSSKQIKATSQLIQIIKQPSFVKKQARLLKIESTDHTQNAYSEIKQVISTSRRSPSSSKIVAPQFFQRKIKFRNNSLVNLNQDLVNQIKGTFYRDKTLEILLKKICFTISQLHSYKSEKAITFSIQNLLQSHIRFQEIEFVFRNLKLKELEQTDVLFYKILINCTINNDNKLTLKKNKPDPLFMQALYDFSEKLEDLFKKLCEDSYKQLEQTIITQKQKLIDKEIEMMHQFSKQGKRDSYNQFQLILDKQFKMNTRVMESRIMTQITEFEEKYGSFNQIENSHRFISNKLNDVVYDIKNTHHQLSQ